MDRPNRVGETGGNLREGEFEVRRVREIEVRR